MRRWTAVLSCVLGAGGLLAADAAGAQVTKAMTGVDWTMVGLFFAVLVGIPLAAARKGSSSSK